MIWYDYRMRTDVNAMDGVSGTPRQTVKCQKDTKVTRRGEPVLSGVSIAKSETFKPSPNSVERNLKQNVSMALRERMTLRTCLDEVVQFLVFQFPIPHNHDAFFEASFPGHELCGQSERARGQI